mgnify:CR=1 FL=1
MNQQENREIRISPDALIALIVAEAEDRELSAMPSLEEMNAAFHPSEEFQKKMDRLLKQAKRKQERKGAWRTTKRLFVVATTVVTAFACILMPVQGCAGGGGIHRAELAGSVCGDPLFQGR